MIDFTFGAVLWPEATWPGRAMTGSMKMSVHAMSGKAKALYATLCHATTGRVKKSIVSKTGSSTIPATKWSRPLRWSLSRGVAEAR
ncbi:uncharacterized protein B0H18DRAFT_986588 [Fomitopsis serialis]|uniref:uncharacterized protein n=1 Tax=Fomitopsis serialis TaxID=139415 RepID=UPI0020087DA6|nr:uncharacterized protein B0H18DRAFT_986588 [Neoantrodia serialis]KAH9932609.1 hypothetical protein B0H18DRAFT_986588 [Neoantrodia serialis]